MSIKNSCGVFYCLTDIYQLRHCHVAFFLASNKHAVRKCSSRICSTSFDWYSTCLRWTSTSLTPPVIVQPVCTNFYRMDYCESRLNSSCVDPRIASLRRTVSILVSI
ncbi:hypothetical protein L596_023024 [Steinernema carpocapsae]|uniref:Uncharacterized protein n=1 Tax=Steinernema carpocapsae TaxID=34508 RepID=A0A4U5MCG2_STECR|nr:hypothetical protein L596_023024 [Steinernema carpocapsae]